MLLTIDAGNTNVNFAIFENNNLYAKWSASSSIYRTADEWASWLIGLMSIANIDPKMIKASIISCVVPRLLPDLKDLCKQHFGHHPQVIGIDNLDYGLELEVDNPSEVGADILVAAVIAKRCYGEPCLILDMGTATTLTLLNHHGNFAGVAIAPGLKSAMGGLTDNAAKLPQVSWSKTDEVIGTNTISAMQGGIFWGYLGLVENLIAKASSQYIEKHPEAKLKVIATGGLAHFVVKHTNLIDYFEPDLVLMGLRYIYERNQSLMIGKLSLVS